MSEAIRYEFTKEKPVDIAGHEWRKEEYLTSGVTQVSCAPPDDSEYSVRWALYKIERANMEEKTIVDPQTDKLTKLQEAVEQITDAEVKLVNQKLDAVIEELDEGLTLAEKDFGTLEDRVKALENKFKNGFTLKSEDGEYAITLSAGQTGCGIWLCRNNSRGPMVAIYNGFGQGPVIGVYSEDKKEAINIGITRSGLQVYNNKTNKVAHISIEDLQKLVEQLNDKETK